LVCGGFFESKGGVIKGEGVGIKIEGEPFVVIVTALSFGGKTGFTTSEIKGLGVGIKGVVDIVDALSLGGNGGTGKGFTSEVSCAAAVVFVVILPLVIENASPAKNLFAFNSQNCNWGASKPSVTATCYLYLV
jgi:hypothetical protein